MSPSAVTEAAAAAAAAPSGEVVKAKDEQKHVHGGEGLTSLQALSHGGVAIPGTTRPSISPTL